MRKNFDISFMQLGYELIVASREQNDEIQDFVVEFLDKLEKKFGEGDKNVRT